jgi:cytochrome c
MDSFELNKILGAVLGTCLFVLSVHIATGAIFAPPVVAKPGYEVAVKAEASGEKPAAAPAELPIEDLLATASVERGAQISKQCQICHNVQEGKGPKVGPDLYGVVDRPIASKTDFKYSAALEKLKTKVGTWTFDALNAWLTKPSAYAPGTAMTFAGLTRENQRADLIAYLDTLSAHPVPLPTAKK